MKTIHERVADAVRELGAALIAVEKSNGALEKYERTLYPDGATIRQQILLEKDPEWAGLWREAQRAETAEWACTQAVLKLAKRMVKEEKKEATK